MSLHGHKKVKVSKDLKSRYAGRILFVKESPVAGSRVDCFDKHGNIALLGFPTEFLR